MSKRQAHKKAVACRRCHQRFSAKGLMAHRANMRCKKESRD